MRQNNILQNTIFGFAIAIIAALSFFTLFQYHFHNEMNQYEKQFFARDFNSSKYTIVLLGSSHIGMLDAKTIQDKIGCDCTVYNLAMGADTPTKRLSQIRDILKIQPDLVLYGIAYRDFYSNIPAEYLLPEPIQMVKDSMFIQVDFFENPKLVTMNVIKNMLGMTPKLPSTNTTTPFFPYQDFHYGIMSVEEINNYYRNIDFDKFYIPPPSRNNELKSLEVILDRLEPVPVILLITPHNSEYLNRLSDTNKVNFDEIIRHLVGRNNLKVESLMLNYSDMGIWRSANHITRAPEGNIYNEDVSDIILRNMNK